MPELLVFDWDGTLSDSLGRIVTCLQLAAGDLGLAPPTEEAARDIVGLGLTEALQQLFPGLDEALVISLRDSYSRHFIEQDHVPAEFYPGVRDALESFHDAGFTLAVATGKSRRGLNRVLKSLGMEDYFHATRCADETASKPDPAMLYSLLGEFSLEPSAALMVGDTTYDMAMAQAAGVPRLAVSYGAHPRQRLLAHEPIDCIDRFDLIPSVVAEIRAGGRVGGG